jgi:hypothetical protein
MQNMSKRLQDQQQQLVLQQPTTEDQVEIEEPTTLEEKSLSAFTDTFLFLHTVHVFTYMLNK